MNIKRYDFGTQYTGSTGMPAIVEKVDGKYMLVSDHKALDAKYTDLLIQSLDQAKAIKRLNDELEAIGAGGVSMMGDAETPWISVTERLPDQGSLVIVYSPPQRGDWPDSIRIEFDYICPDYEGWHNHSEHYEHYCCVAKGGSGIEWSGPSEKAPYTHWMPLPPIPRAALTQQEQS